MDVIRVGPGIATSLLSVLAQRRTAVSNEKPENAPFGNLSRRNVFGIGSTLAAAALAGVAANAQQIRSSDHHLPNESDPGPKNSALEAENPDSVWSPETDNGTVAPFKYSFALARKRVESGGWTRQVTMRELPISKTMAEGGRTSTRGGRRRVRWSSEAE